MGWNTTKDKQPFRKAIVPEWRCGEPGCTPSIGRNEWQNEAQFVHRVIYVGPNKSWAAASNEKAFPQLNLGKGFLKRGRAL